MTKGDQRAADQQPVRTNKLPLVLPLAGTERRFINIDDLTPQSVWRVYGDSFASEKDLIRHEYTGSHTHTDTQPSVCLCVCMCGREGGRWLGDKHKSLTSEHGRCQHSYVGNMGEHKLRCTQSARVQSPSLFIYLNVVKPCDRFSHGRKRNPKYSVARFNMSLLLFILYVLSEQPPIAS